MVGIFEEKICSYCKNSNCKKQINTDVEKDITTYKCDEYIKDVKKIIPYQEPLKVLADRDYVKKYEI